MSNWVIYEENLYLNKCHSKRANNKYVAMDVLLRICVELDWDINDILEIKK